MDKYDRLNMAKKAARLNNEDLGKFLGITSSGVAVAFSRKNLSSLKINILVEKMNLNPDWVETGLGEMYLNNRVSEPLSTYGIKLAPEQEMHKKNSVSDLAAAQLEMAATLKLQAEMLSKQSDIQERYIKLLEELRGK